MKKIDLHIHTVPTVRDSHFTFSLPNLKRYVSEANLDGIAITNHDLFDSSQFAQIRAAVDIPVFPAIEVTLSTGHVLIISDGDDLDDFDNKTDLIEQRIQSNSDRLPAAELEAIFGDLGDYLVIPHYDKKPAVRGEELELLREHSSAGEVDSAKKFVRLAKDTSELTPVLFSDTRISDELAELPIRQTYIDCGDLTLSSLKACLHDRSKVALSKNEGNNLFQVLDDGQMLSTGLNILLGERSSGKTYTLDRICDSVERTKYIKQFSLVQQDDDAYEREFNKDINRKRSNFSDEFLREFKAVLDDVIGIDLHQNACQVEDYLSSLLKSASEAERKDLFSRTTLFDESLFTTKEDRVLSELIQSVRFLIENLEYRSVIEKHVKLDSLRSLACELIEILWDKEIESKKKKLTNSIITEIKDRLRRRTSATQIEDVDLYQIMLDQTKIEKFEQTTKDLQAEAEISREDFQGFRVVTSKAPFAGAGEIKNVSGQKVAFSEAYKEYDLPYKYLRTLVSNEALTPSEFYKYFVRIDYKILNKDGFEVSGGERSEFRLLQEIKDAQNYDILLIDEPESSFDNIFLNSEVNQMIKDISTVMPVVVVTHSSTVGASIGADYVIYARKERDESGLAYQRYSGHPTDKKLVDVNGQLIDNFDAILDSLEAGSEAYSERGRLYEAIKD